MSSSESDDAGSQWSFEGILPTPLHAAAVNGNKPLLQSLLQEGEKNLINKGDQFGRTPLVYSVLGDRLDCAELLLKAGANVSSCDVDGRTPLHWAAYQGNLKCVKLLLSKGANWKVKDNEGRTPLHFATSHQSSKCLSLLLKRVPKGEANEPDNDRMTSLHWSASYGNVEHVKLLLKAGAGVKLTDLENKTPLHWAATNPDPAVVKLLLDSNSDITNLQDNEGRTALHLAVARQNEAVVKVLISLDKCNVSIQDHVSRSPLHWAAVLGNPQLVKLLLQKNADYKAADGNGATALHYVAQSNFSETVKVFLSFDRMEDVPDNEGRTALMWAAGKGAENALKTMLERDLDVHTKDKTGGTALHAAAYAGHVNCVKLLIEYGACVDALDMLQHTPLYRACEMGHTEVVNNLILNGATVNLEDQDGRSPLHWAALGGHALICLALIQLGLSPDSKDHLGRTPLQCAAYGGFVNCMTVLIEHEAYVNHQDKEGITALHWSCSSGHLEAVKLLLRNIAFPNFREEDGERLTPLDYAIIGDHQDVAQFMIEQGALTINGIQDIAATTIQSCWRGYQVRKSFQNRKNLLMRHEQLKDMKKRASAAEQRRSGSGVQSLSVPSTPRDKSHVAEDDSGRDLGDASILDKQQTRELSLNEETRNYSLGESKDNLLNERRRSSLQRISPPLSGPSVNASSAFFDLTFGPESDNLRLYVENSLQADQGRMEVVSPVSIIADLECQVSSSLLDVENSRKQSFHSREFLPEEKKGNFIDKDVSKVELARKERERLHLIRTKVNAAVMIQRWFRKHASIKREHLARDVMMSDVMKEQEELSKEVAALTIQLAWRKHVRVKFEKNTAATKKKNPKKGALNSSPCKPKQNGIHINGRSFQQTTSVKNVNPRTSQKRRPAYTKYLSSPAAMSYNMAMDLYHPLGSRQGNSRAAMVTGSTRVRPGSMKRTVNGWSHDSNFATGTHGQRPGSKDRRS